MEAMDPIDQLAAIDEQLATFMQNAAPEDMRDYIKALYLKAFENPGRATKLRVTYLMERMLEIIDDLRDADAGFEARSNKIVFWVDRGLSNVTGLLTREGRGKFLANFDNIIKEEQIPDFKDPAESEARRQRAEDMLPLLQKVRSEARQRQDRQGKKATPGLQAGEPRKGGLIIVPGDTL